LVHQPQQFRPRVLAPEEVQQVKPELVVQVVLDRFPVTVDQVDGRYED